MENIWLEQLKIILREEEIPFFSDGELEFYYNKNHQSLNDTAYECLLIKSENNTLVVSGLTLPDSSTYFRRMAARYRPNHSGILRG